MRITNSMNKEIINQPRAIVHSLLFGLSDTPLSSGAPLFINMKTTGILFNGYSWTARIYEKEKHKNTHIGSFKTREEAVQAKRDYVAVNYPNGYSADTHFHGMWGTRLYWIWHSMVSRCENPKHKHYKYYGGKGIQICEGWHKFTTFRDWALLNGYKEYLTIDRINGDKNYEPTNCRWATRMVQIANQKRSDDCGIFFDKSFGFYKIKIQRNNRLYYGGLSKNIETARMLRDELIKKIEENPDSLKSMPYLKGKRHK